MTHKRNKSHESEVGVSETSPNPNPKPTQPQPQTHLGVNPQTPRISEAFIGYKISAIVFLSFTMIISSCKKEETIVEGCIDSSAMNYSSNATSNDGSCVYAYDIAQGDWDITPACDDIIFFGFPIPLDSLLPKTIQINGEEDGVISLDINGNSIFKSRSFNN